MIYTCTGECRHLILGLFFRPRITKVTFKGKIFIIKVRDKNVSNEHNVVDQYSIFNIWSLKIDTYRRGKGNLPLTSSFIFFFFSKNDEHTYAFEVATKTRTKHLWKCCVEHHTFFRYFRMQQQG